MPLTTTDLRAAFNRTGLQRNGTSFNQAIACDMLKKCLVRIALNAQNKAPSATLSPQGASPQNIGAKAPYSYVKHYWWQEI